MAVVKEVKADSDLLPEALEIREKLKEGFPRDTLNILFLGSPGAGKSSLINSLIAAIDKHGYRECATKGAGSTRAGDANVTGGLSAVKMFNIPLVHKEEIKFKCKPVLWDFAGLMNNDEQRLLKMVLKGQTQSKTALGQMRSWWYRTWDYWTGFAHVDKRIHLVIFVHPADTAPPELLLESFSDLVRSQNDMKYEVTTMLVLTKEDKVTVTETEIENDKQKLSLNSNVDLDDIKKKIKQTKLDSITDIAANRLKMMGVYERIMQVSNYSQETAGDKNRDIKRNHEIDEKMCRLWNKIIEPQYYTQYQKK